MTSNRDSRRSARPTRFFLKVFAVRLYPLRDEPTPGSQERISHGSRTRSRTPHFLCDFRGDFPKRGVTVPVVTLNRPNMVLDRLRQLVSEPTGHRRLVLKGDELSPTLVPPPLPPIKGTSGDPRLFTDGRHGFSPVAYRFEQLEPLDRRHPSRRMKGHFPYCINSV